LRKKWYHVPVEDALGAQKGFAMADSHQNVAERAKKPMWRAPVLTEDAISDVTQFTVKGAGADAGAASPGYSTLGLS